MAESNPTQVILTDDGLKIIKTQNTADEAAGNINDINSDNKLTPSEKLKLKQEYDKDVELYNIDIEQLKSVNLPTAELETAMSNLTNFVTPLFKEMNITSTIDRNALNSVFTAFATADKNASQTFVNMVQQVADDAKKAGDDAKEAGEKAQEAGEEAKTAADQAQVDATQAKADAATAQQKAQSSIDQFNAHLPDIDEALSTANLVKQNVTKLSNTTEQYHNEYTTGIQDVVKTIDDITIGGTNLIKNSSSDVVIDDTVKNQGWVHSAIYSELEVGQEYTFTSSVTVNAGKADNICINVYNPSNGATTLDSNQPIVNGKIEYTFTAVKDYPTLLVYAGVKGGNQGNKVTFHHYQLEKGNKATDWSPAPEDLATSTEIDQLNNAIKLKADSTDVTSQITVATTGIQNTVNNKADKSQVSQLADQITSVVSDVNEGKINLIVNGGFENGTDNWIFEDLSNWSINKNNGYQPFSEDYIRITPDGKGYITQKLVKFNGLSVSDWNFNFYYSIQNNVSGYVKAYLRIDYEDGTLKYINDTKLTANNNAWQRMSVKINKTDLSAVAGIALGLQFIGASGGGNVYFSQFQISRGADDKPYTKSNLDNASQSQITQLKNDINLRVSKNDAVNQINISNEGILIDGKKIHITGNTSIDNAVIKNGMIADAAINNAKIADGAINNAKIANAAIDDAKISNLNGNKIIAGSITADKINVDDLIANGINTKTLTSVNINTPNLNLGDNGQITGTYSVNDDTGWFQPINGSGTLQISNGYIRSTANILYYNKILNGIGGDKWGHWASSTQFVPAPDQAHPDIGNIAESTFTPAFLKLDIFEADKSKVNSRVYIDGTGLYINDGGTQAVSAMLSDYELISSGMAYLNSGIQMKQGASFTFGNLAMNGSHTIAMLDSNALYFSDKVSGDGNPIEIKAKAFTKASRLSIKHDIKPLSTAESLRLLNAIDIEKFRYTHDGATYKYQYGGVIDDVNSLGSKQYSMPPELLSEDGTGINLDSLTGILVKRVQDQGKTIAELSMRLTKLEMEK